MPVPSVVTDLTAVAASNSPSGSDAVFPELDNYLRAYGSFIKQNYDSLSAKASTSAPAFTGTVSCSGGASFGNTAVASATVLDYYLEGMAGTGFTPSLTFGGAAVGMTFATRHGTYIRVGRAIHFTARVRLSAKGSSTGTAVLTGLPVAGASSGAAENPFSIEAVNMTGLTAALAASGVASATTVSLLQWGSTGLVGITDTVFTANSDIYVSGVYFVD